MVANSKTHIQTTWGSRDGADDYDAERMKRRTDADRTKQPYYPSYLTT